SRTILQCHLALLRQHTLECFLHVRHRERQRRRQATRERDDVRSLGNLEDFANDRTLQLFGTLRELPLDRGGLLDFHDSGRKTSSLERGCVGGCNEKSGNRKKKYLIDLGNQLDLDTSSQRDLCDTESRTRMTPLFTENFAEQIRCTVGNQMLLGEIRR